VLIRHIYNYYQVIKNHTTQIIITWSELKLYIKINIQKGERILYDVINKEVICVLISFIQMAVMLPKVYMTHNLTKVNPL